MRLNFTDARGACSVTLLAPKKKKKEKETQILTKINIGPLYRELFRILC